MISTRLKTLRQQKGWSLDVASQKTGVSKAMLGQIERVESCPTIATLWKIASGFEVSFSSFIEKGTEDNIKPIHRVGDPKQLNSEELSIRVSTLFPYDQKLHFEVFMIELLPGCKHLSPPHKEGVIEHVIVMEGNIEVFTNGYWHKVGTNEGLKFQADQNHGYRNLSSNKATFYNTIHYPRLSPFTKGL